MNSENKHIRISDTDRDGEHQETNQPQKYTDKHRIAHIVKDKNKLTTPARPSDGREPSQQDGGQAGGEERDGRTQKDTEMAEYQIQIEATTRRKTRKRGIVSGDFMI